MRTSDRRWWLTRWGGLFICAVLAAGYPPLIWWNVALYPCPYGLIATEGGCVGACWTINRTPMATKTPSVHVQRESLRPSEWGWLPRQGGTMGLRWALVPVWLLMIMAGVPTTLAWRAELRRSRRARIGKCRGCGYDLAGLAESAACPECGKTR